MDQDSFRQLISTASTKPAAAAKALGAAHKSKPKKAALSAKPSEPEFKPRAVKKHDRYRDRAEERRLGTGNDYAQVEALAEDFEKRNADQDRETLEEQRRYLGGDSEHTVLVRGLDFALLEQNRARAAAATEDDDLLEQAFEEAVTVPKKRTRDEIIRELKSKRQKSEGALEPPLDDAKKAGKFKPIGFKPIGQAEGAKKKKVKKGKGKEKEVAAAGAKKKAAAKTDAEPAPESSSAGPAQQPAAPSTSKPPAPPEPKPEPLDEDFDIFAGAGDYTGVDMGDDDEESDGGVRPGNRDSPGSDDAPAPHKWFDTDDEPRAAQPTVTPPPESASPPPAQAREEGEAEDEDEAQARLAPLASSAMPSIREFLAMEAEAEKEEKRRARKEKKKKAA